MHQPFTVYTASDCDCIWCDACELASTTRGTDDPFSCPDCGGQADDAIGTGRQHCYEACTYANDAARSIIDDAVVELADGGLALAFAGSRPGAYVPGWRRIEVVDGSADVLGLVEADRGSGDCAFSFDGESLTVDAGHAWATVEPADPIFDDLKRSLDLRADEAGQLAVEVRGTSARLHDVAEAIADEIIDRFGVYPPGDELADVIRQVAERPSLQAPFLSALRTTASRTLDPNGSTVLGRALSAAHAVA